MATKSSPDLVDFSRRVERLCDFLLDRIFTEVGRTGSDEQKIIEDLKEEAANMQVEEKTILSDSFAGLRDYMNGTITLEEQPS